MLLCCRGYQKYLIPFQYPVKDLVRDTNKIRRFYVTDTDANLLARTRLRAPMRVGSGPSVDAMIRVVGSPRQMVASTVVRISAEMTGHARTIGPPTITA